jgi:DNA integrity scanning protein DisA with diadenylate cyclase activity
MSEEIITMNKNIPSVDFSYQFNMAKEKVEKKIFSYLCDIAKEFLAENKRLGILVVMGTFSGPKNSTVIGMRRLGTDNLQKYINIMFPQFKEDIVKMFEEGLDGAIVIDDSGHILANRIYLTVDNPLLEIPDGTSTRHISAASFSCRTDVSATFTLSEETLHVRMWKEGVFIEHFDPHQENIEQ